MNQIMWVITALAVIFLGFVAGVSTMHFGGPTSEYFREVFLMIEKSGSAQQGETRNTGPQFLGLLNTKKIDGINPPVPAFEPGLRKFDASRVQPGYTLYTPVYPWLPVRLIDMQGNSVHEWRLPDSFAELERQDGVKYPRRINPPINDMHVYPNGNLLVVTGNDLGRMPYGYAVAMLDKDSNVLWTYTKEVHHQLDVATDGRIAVMLNRKHDEHWLGYKKIRLPYLDEEIVILSPEGEELSATSLLKAFKNSEWEAALQLANPRTPSGDIFHLNAAKFLTAEQAEAIPNAEQGNMLLSIRNMNVIAVLDVEDEEIVWAAKGPWYRQHDPQVTPEGKLLIFDNHGDFNRERGSRIIEVDPRTLAVVWEWPGKHQFNLYSSVMGSVERLANGNTLLAETNRGRIIEVAPNGDVVWEYVIPERIQMPGDYMTTKVWHPQRIDAASLTFLEGPG